LKRYRKNSGKRSPNNVNQRIVLATGNTGKLKEIRVLLRETEWEILGQSKFDVREAEETGLTFVENALIKARNACKQTGLPAIADDSGLEVDALNGEPGIYSARYAGKSASDADNIEKLLQELLSVPDHQRQARFRCVMVYMRHASDPSPIICRGHWEGRIARGATGKNGFGYDPVFWLPEYRCSAAELSSEKKNRLSHRSEALKQLHHQLV